MPAAWFPARERATAVGLITIAKHSGHGGGACGDAGSGGGDELSPRCSLCRGAAVPAAALFVAVAKEKPACPPDEVGITQRALHD